MASVAVNPPKTPVTKGSSGIAAATTPNVCKMPGPPAPFVPTPLPNVGRSGNSPKGYSNSVKFEGNAVAIRGASFGSQGDIASKGTGGGIVSMNTHGPTKFVAPGSLDVKVEGKNVQFLSDQMSNNNGPSGSPPNSATLAGVLQAPNVVVQNASGDDTEQKIRCAIKECDKKDAKGKKYKKGMDCKSLGTAKHSCVAEKLKGKEPAIFCETSVVMKPTPMMVLSSKGKKPAIFWEGIRKAKEVLGKTAIARGDLRRPDTIFRDKSGQLRIIDAKFPCDGHDATWRPGQKEDYEKIVGDGNVEGVSPADVQDDECPSS